MRKILYNIIPWCSKISHITLLVDSDFVFQGCPQHGLAKNILVIASVPGYKFHHKQTRLKHYEKIHVNVQYEVQKQGKDGNYARRLP